MRVQNWRRTSYEERSDKGEIGVSRRDKQRFDESGLWVSRRKDSSNTHSAQEKRTKEKLRGDRLAVSGYCPPIITNYLVDPQGT